MSFFLNLSKTQEKKIQQTHLRFNYKEERVKWESKDREENWTTVGNGNDEEFIELILTENDLN